MPQRSNLSYHDTLARIEKPELQHEWGFQHEEPLACANGFEDSEGELQEVGFQRRVSKGVYADEVLWPELTQIDLNSLI